MGFRLEIVGTGRTPYDDSITLVGMDRLLNAALFARVNLHTKRRRTWEKWDGKKFIRVPVTQSLGDALAYNNGSWVTPEEAAKLAKALPKAASVSEDPEFIREMAKFFSAAAKHGGVYVF